MAMTFEQLKIVELAIPAKTFASTDASISPTADEVDASVIEPQAIVASQPVAAAAVELPLSESVEQVLREIAEQVAANKGFQYVQSVGFLLNFVPDDEDVFEGRNDVVFAKLEENRDLRYVVAQLQERGYYVEYVGEAVSETYWTYQTVRIERAQTFGKWLEARKQNPRVHNATGWQHEQLDRLMVVGFYGLTPRLILRRISPKSKAHDGLYYFLKFTKKGSGKKGREIAERDTAFEFGKVNPYLKLDSFQFFNVAGKEEDYQKLRQVETDLRYEVYGIRRQRREGLFHHLYRDRRRRRRESNRDFNGWFVGEKRQPRRQRTSSTKYNITDNADRNSLPVSSNGLIYLEGDEDGDF